MFYRCKDNTKKYVNDEKSVLIHTFSIHLFSRYIKKQYICHYEYIDVLLGSVL